ncbi:MAG TPA: hypothetical protein PLD53_09385, partial [Candidatus Propionivibrio aalborgensis]|nr:hypothetical protein [Candidatus Propionivibrio aalborgensis]
TGSKGLSQQRNDGAAPLTNQAKLLELHALSNTGSRLMWPGRSLFPTLRKIRLKYPPGFP